MLGLWIEATRPKTLPAAVVPVMVGTAEAYRMGSFAWWPVFSCLLFALLVQIGTNMANDYYDYIRGADTSDRLGPERMVASGKIPPATMLRASLAIFAIAFAIGLSLVYYRGWELLFIGVFSIIFGFGYTGGPFPLAYKGLGDVFVIFFFGLVATMGTYFVLLGEVTLEVGLLGFALGLLANNILVVNNYRDRETDRRADKMTMVARFGKGFGCRQYWIQLLLAFGSMALYAFLTARLMGLLPLLLLPLGVRMAGSLSVLEGRALNGLLARTAGLLLASGILLAFGITVG